MSKIVIFGGAGFIGSHFVEFIISQKKFEKIILIDKLTYAGNPIFINKICQNSRITFIQADINDSEKYSQYINDAQLAVNFAAESHVDRSIVNPNVFIESNVQGVNSILQACMNLKVRKFVQVSTDEVYGSIIERKSIETDSLQPSSPYAASKASGDLIVLAYWKTFNYEVNITRGANTYGPRQFPEKLIPLALKKLKNGEKVPIYGNGLQIREWLHVMDHVEGIWQICERGEPGEIYNIGSGEYLNNLDVIRHIANNLKIQSKNYIEFVDDRLGHDQRYSLNLEKIEKSLGWKRKRSFVEEITKSSNW